MPNQNKIDKMMQEIEEKNGNVQFIPVSSPEQPVDNRNIAEWFFDEIIKFMCFR